MFANKYYNIILQARTTIIDVVTALKNETPTSKVKSVFECTLTCMGIVSFQRLHGINKSVLWLLMTSSVGSFSIGSSVILLSSLKFFSRAFNHKIDFVCV